MKATIKYSLSKLEEQIDLTDYGHDENTRFEDLSEEEQNEILDPLRMGNIANASVRTIEE